MALPVITTTLFKKHQASQQELRLQAGENKVVQELLGHNQISMTMDIYSHVLPTMQKEAVSKLDDALQG